MNEASTSKCLKDGDVRATKVVAPYDLIIENMKKRTSYVGSAAVPGVYKTQILEECNGTRLMGLLLVRGT